MEQVSEGLYKISTCACWDGVPVKVFKCFYNFDTAKGLPQSMYEAFAYLCSQLSLPKEHMLEIFSFITCALHHLDFDILFESKPGTMGSCFDVEKALEHDLKYNC